VVEQVHPGIWKITYGWPERMRPTDFKEPARDGDLRTRFPADAAEPEVVKQIHFRQVPRGVVGGFRIEDLTCIIHKKTRKSS